MGRVSDSRQLDFGFATPVARRARLTDPLWSQAAREQLAARLARHLGDRLFQISLNDNSSTVVSVRQRHGRLEISLHHMFLEAGEADLRALAGYLRGDKRTAARLDAFIARNRNRLARPRSRPRPSAAAGSRFDLVRIRDALGRAYFGGPLEVPIEWGLDRRRRRGRSIRLGSYSFEDGVIRIHPALDQAFVPAWVVVGVVYHELLHHVLGAERRGRRRLLHGPEFRRRERAFVHHARAVRWENENLERLLRREARGQPSTRRASGLTPRRGRR